MEKAALIAWVLSVINFLSPPGRTHYTKEAQETLDEAKNRHALIAEAIVDVAFDESEAPLYGGRRGRHNTALTMVSVAFNESGFRRDVDLGLGRLGRGDYGRSWCMMQLNLGKKIVEKGGKRVEDSAELTSDGWSGVDLVADRRKCFKAGLHAMRRSFMSCQVGTAKAGTKLMLHGKEVVLEEDTTVPLPMYDRLSQYATGKCTYGQHESRTRMNLAFSLMKRFPPKKEEVSNGNVR